MSDSRRSGYSSGQSQLAIEDSVRACIAKSTDNEEIDFTDTRFLLIHLHTENELFDQGRIVLGILLA